MSRVNLNIRVLGFTATVSMLSILLFGLVPIIRTAKLNLNSALKGESSIDKIGIWTALPGLEQADRRWADRVFIAVAGVRRASRSYISESEWSGGRFRSGKRPPSFRSSVHAGAVTSDPGGRLFRRMTSLPGVESATYYFYNGMLDIGGAHSFTPIRMPGSISSATEAPEAVVFPVGPR